MIDLFILRHGAAVSREEWAPKRESERPLTAKGEKQICRIGKALRNGEFSFGLILTSPYVRARHTAEIVAASLHQEEKLKLSQSLKPQSSPRAFLDEARHLFGSAESVLVVGHEPFLTGLISLLIRADAQTQLKLKKGGLCKLKVEALKPGGGLLEWLLTSRQAAAMGDA